MFSKLLIFSSEADFFFGSYVEQFGNLDMDKEVVGNFLSIVGRQTTQETSNPEGMEFLTKFPHLSRDDPLFKHSHRLPWGVARVEQTDADIMFFMHKALKAESLDATEEMLGVLREMLHRR